MSITRGPDRIFQDYLAAGEVRLQRCMHCVGTIFFPRLLCPHCGSSDLDWPIHSGKGIVYSTTVMRRRAESGGDSNIAIIEMEGGARMLSRVEGIDPGKVSIGMGVNAKIATSGDGSKMLVFEPAETSHAY